MGFEEKERKQMEMVKTVCARDCPDTCFIDVVLWQKQAELCHKYLRKGSPIFIEGRLSFESWDDRDGNKRSKLKVVAERMQFVDGGGEQGSGPGPQGAPTYGNEAPQYSGNAYSAPSAPPASYNEGPSTPETDYQDSPQINSTSSDIPF